jgi:hypothetical protein
VISNIEVERVVNVVTGLRTENTSLIIGEDATVFIAKSVELANRRINASFSVKNRK